MKKDLFLILFLSVAAGLLYNFNNLSLIRAKNPENITSNTRSTLHDITIWSVDNEYYLSPAENYMAGKGWRRSPAVGSGSYTRRTPGYSLVYYACIKLAGNINGLHLLRSFQFLLFILSVAAIYKLLALLKATNFTRISLSLLYGTSPWFSSYTFFTLTESLTPYLIIFYVYFLFAGLDQKETKKQMTFFVLASFFIGYAILTRPILAMAGFLLPLAVIQVFIHQKNMKALLVKLAVAGFVPVIMVGAWTTRNYLVSREVVILEKMMDPETLDPLKPEMKALWGLTKCWGAEHLWIYQSRIFQSVLDGDTAANDHHIIALYHSFPESAVSLFGKDSILSVLNEYKDVLKDQKPYYDLQQAMPATYTLQQTALTEKFNKMKIAYQKEYPFESFVISPLKYLKLVILHSNTSNLFVFSNDFRNQSFLNLTRLTLAGLHILLYLVLFVQIFFFKKSRSFEFATFFLLPCMAIFFFIFLHQEYEQRYMLPLLPLVLLGAYRVLDALIQSIIHAGILKPHSTSN